MELSAVVVGYRGGAVTKCAGSGRDRLQQFDWQPFTSSNTLQVPLVAGFCQSSRSVCRFNLHSIVRDVFVRTDHFGGDLIAEIRQRRALLCQLAAVQTVLSTRLADASGAVSVDGANQGDRLLTVDEVVRRTGMSRDYIYRHANAFPFTRRLGRSLRFSERGMLRWLDAQRKR